MKQFVILEHLCLPDRGFRFITSNSDNDPTRLFTGEVVYKIVGYTDTIEEAQSMRVHDFMSASSNELELYYRLKEPICYSIKGISYEPQTAIVEYATK